MKTKILTIAIALSAVVATAQAQTVVTTNPGTITTYSGTVSQVDPSSQTIILQGSAEAGAPAAPTTYTLTPQTVVVDSNGNPVPLDTIRNSQVRVEYTKDNGRTIVKKVITTTAAPVGAAPPVVIGH